MAATLADDIFECMFFNKNVWILIKISLKFVPKGRPGDKPLSEPMICRRLFASGGLDELERYIFHATRLSIHMHA